MKYIKLVLLLCICMSCNNTTQDNKQNTPPKDSTVATIKDSVIALKDSIQKPTPEVVDTIFPPPDFEKIKAKCRYINKRKFDLQEDLKGLWFSDDYQLVITKDFYSLGLDQVMDHKPDFQSKYTPYVYYAFQENVNGNIGLVIGYVSDGFKILKGLIYDKTGKFIDQIRMAAIFSDMGFNTFITSRFKNDSTYQLEYKTDNSNQVPDTHYKLDLTFTKEGKIVAGDTTFLLKPPPKKNN